MRDYDPTTGRYLQADPLGLVDGPSVYGYARQSPVRYADFTGKRVVLVCRPVKNIGFIPGAIHCAVFVVESECKCLPKDSDGVNTQFTFPGGARKFVTKPDKGGVYGRDRKAYNNPGGPRITHYDIAVPGGMTSCEFDMNVTDVGGAYSQGPYNAVFGPNSNTAADNLIELSGGVAPETGARAQNYEPPPYPAPWPMP